MVTFHSYVSLPEGNGDSDRLYDHLPTEKLGHCSPRRFCWIGITLNVHDPWAMLGMTQESRNVEMGNSTKYGYFQIEKMMIGCG